MTTTLCTKRLLSEIDKIMKDPIEDVDVVIDNDNLLIWYFLIKGKDEYKNGYFIGKITNNVGYPMEPPTFSMLTPSGRFEINKNICLSNSSYHSESWNPLWTMKSIILGFISIMYDYSETAFGLGHLRTTKEEKKKFADISVAYNRQYHFKLFTKFIRFIEPIKNEKILEEMDEYLSGIKKVIKNTFKHFNKKIEKIII